MAETAVVETTTTETSAADKAVADSAAATAAASAASTDTTAAVVEAVVVPTVPEKYDLKLPDGSTLDPAIMERTAATARALGLSNEAGQKLLDSTVQEITSLEQAAVKAATDAKEALISAWKPGGTEWVKRDAEWTTAAKSDPELGKTAEEFTVTVERAQQALAKFGPELKPLLDETGFGSHPAVIKMLSRIGRGMSEGTLILGSGGKVTTQRTVGQTLYPQHYNEDGSPK